MHALKPIKKAIQKGFTLIELIIVVVILGILTAIVATQFSGGVTDSARATAFYSTAQKITSSWQILNQVCGTPNAVAGNPIPATTDTGTPTTGQHALTILFQGAANASGNFGNLTSSGRYNACYQTSGLKPLAELAQTAPASASATGFTVQNAPVTFGNFNGGGALQGAAMVTFQDVPDQQIIALVNKYGNPATELKADGTLNSNDVSANVQWANPTHGVGGAHDLIIVRNI